MDTELQNTNHGVHVNIKKEKIDNDQSSFEATDTHCHTKKEIDDRGNQLQAGYSHLQNIENLHQNIETGMKNINQQVKVNEEKVENNQSHFENIDSTHCFETRDPNFEDIDNLKKTMGIGIRNIKQEAEVDKQMLENLHSHFENNDNIYIFENTDSNFQDKDNVDDDMFVQVHVMNIKQEIQDHQEQILESEDKHYSQYMKDNLNFEGTERTDLTITNAKSDSELNSNIVDQTSNVNIELNDLKSENGPSNNTGSEFKLDNSGSSLHRCGATANDTRSDFNIHESSSLNIDMDFKIENGLNIDNCNLKSEDAELNSEKFASVNESIEFVSERADSQADPVDSGDGHRLEVDLQPIVMLKRLPDTVFKQGSQVYPITQNDFSLRKNNFSCLSEECTFTDYCNRENSGKLAIQMKINTDVRHVCSLISERPHQCNSCDKKFKTVFDLRKHMISHSTERPHQCDMCNNTFKTSYSLKLHKVSHRTERPHRCNVCEKGFKSPDALIKHMTSHSTERLYQCNVCDKGFKSSITLRKHMISHSTERPHQCDMCNNKFKTSYSLKLHRLSHSTERPHQCNVCEKGFKSSDALKRHMTSHSTERSHQCNVCGKAFKSSDTLRKHHVSHSNERPHQCNVCEKRFQYSAVLRRHMNIHKTDRRERYQCDVCEIGFKSSNYLRVHMITHNTDRPHTCNVCETGFETLQDFRKHMFTHNNERPHQID